MKGGRKRRDKELLDRKARVEFPQDIDQKQYFITKYNVLERRKKERRQGRGGAGQGEH